MYKILFVCTGNICRSPTAEGVLRHRLEKHGLSGRIQVDSAGTHGYHVGEAPDRRSVLAAKMRGILIHDLRARKVCREDFSQFDLILGLDGGHVRMLKEMSPAGANAEIALFLADGQDVPDPYYGDAHGFERVLDLIETGVDALAERLKTQLGEP